MSWQFKSLASLVLAMTLTSLPILYLTDGRGIFPSPKFGQDLGGGRELIFDSQTSSLNAHESKSQERTNISIQILRRRLGLFGKDLATVNRKDNNQVMVRIPYIYEADWISKLITANAEMAFYRTCRTDVSDCTKIKFDGKDIWMKNQPDLDSADIQSVQAHRADKKGRYAIVISFSKTGQEKFWNLTSSMIGSNIAVAMDEDVIGLPMVMEAIKTRKLTITGNFNRESASHIVNLVKSGGGPEKLRLVSQTNIAPTLGTDLITYFSCLLISLISVCLLYILARYKTLGACLVISTLAASSAVLVSAAIIGLPFTCISLSGWTLGLAAFLFSGTQLLEEIRQRVSSGDRFKRVVLGVFDLAQDRLLKLLTGWHLYLLIALAILPMQISRCACMILIWEIWDMLCFITILEPMSRTLAARDDVRRLVTRM